MRALKGRRVVLNPLDIPHPLATSLHRRENEGEKLDYLTFSTNFILHKMVSLVALDISFVIDYR